MCPRLVPACTGQVSWLSPFPRHPLPQPRRTEGPRGVPARGGAGRGGHGLCCGCSAPSCLSPGIWAPGNSLGVSAVSSSQCPPFSPQALPAPSRAGSELAPAGPCPSLHLRPGAPPARPRPPPLPPGSSIPLGMNSLLLHVSRCPCTLRGRDGGSLAPAPAMSAPPQPRTVRHLSSSRGNTRSLRSPTVALSPGQRHGQHEAPLWVAKGWSRDRDPQPTLLPAGGRRRRQPGERALYPCASPENQVKSTGMPWQRVRPGLAEHPPVPGAWQGLVREGKAPAITSSPSVPWPSSDG